MTEGPFRKRQLVENEDPAGTGARPVKIVLMMGGVCILPPSILFLFISKGGEHDCT
jgi:hypothetical protein